MGRLAVLCLLLGLFACSRPAPRVEVEEDRADEQDAEIEAAIAALYEKREGEPSSWSVFVRTQVVIEHAEGRVVRVRATSGLVGI